MAPPFFVVSRTDENRVVLGKVYFVQDIPMEAIMLDSSIIWEIDNNWILSGMKTVIIDGLAHHYPQRLRKEQQ